MKESQRLERGRGRGENEGEEIACFSVCLCYLFHIPKHGAMCGIGKDVPQWLQVRANSSPQLIVECKLCIHHSIDGLQKPLSKLSSYRYLISSHTYLLSLLAKRSQALKKGREGKGSDIDLSLVGTTETHLPVSEDFLL